MSSLLLVEDVAPHVRRLTMNRPEQLNAMTAELCQALHEEIARTAAERSCRVEPFCFIAAFRLGGI